MSLLIVTPVLLGRVWDPPVRFSTAIKVLNQLRWFYLSQRNWHGNKKPIL